MKKLIGLIVVIVLALAGKCYYQKSKLIAFLDSMGEYGYSYKIKKDSLCSMDMVLDLSDPKKYLNIYPKFLRENKKFMSKVQKEFEKNQIDRVAQIYNIKLSIFSFDIVAKSTFKGVNRKLKSEYAKIVEYLASKELIKTTTTCNTLTNKCTIKYDDIDTTYKDTHIATKALATNFKFENSRFLVGDIGIKYLQLKGSSVDFWAKDCIIDIFYQDNRILNIKEILYIGDISIKDKKALNTKLKDVTIGGAYFEDNSSFFQLRAKELTIPDKNMALDIKDLDFLLTIDKESKLKFNVANFNFISKRERGVELKLQNLNSSYRYLDNNILLGSGKSSLDYLYIKNTREEELIVKKLLLSNMAKVNSDKLNIHKLYTLNSLDFRLKKVPFKVANLKYDLEIKDIGYTIIKEFYSELLKVYKKAFIIGFNGNSTPSSRNQIRNEINMITAIYIQRFAELFKYGIKVNLKEFKIKEFDYRGKSAKNAELKANIEFKKLTKQDIVSKKYSLKNLPLKSLKANAKIPKEFLEFNNINEKALPFKFKLDGDLRVVDMDYKDGVIYINGVPMQK